MLNLMTFQWLFQCKNRTKFHDHKKNSEGNRTFSPNFQRMIGRLRERKEINSELLLFGIISGLLRMFAIKTSKNGVNKKNGVLCQIILEVLFHFWYFFCRDNETMHSHVFSISIIILPEFKNIYFRHVLLNMCTWALFFYQTSVKSFYWAMIQQ